MSTTLQHRHRLVALAAGLVAVLATAASAQGTAPKDQGLIAFERFGEGGSGALHVVRADGTRLRKLPGTGDGHEPAWTPDGKRIVFSSTRGGRVGAPELYLVSLTKQDVGRLTTTEYTKERSVANSSPTVSPDGKSIAFVRTTVSGRELQTDLYLASIAGGNETQLTRGDATESAPAWSKNGYIYYVVDGSIFRLVAGGTGFPEGVVHGTNPAPSPTGAGSRSSAAATSTWRPRRGRASAASPARAPA